MIQHNTYKIKYHLIVLGEVEKIGKTLIIVQGMFVPLLLKPMHTAVFLTCEYLLY